MKNFLAAMLIVFVTPAIAGDHNQPQLAYHAPAPTDDEDGDAEDICFANTIPQAEMPDWCAEVLKN